MKIKTQEFLNAMSTLNEFHSMSNFFINEYKNFVRLYSNGSGLLYLIVNNCVDMKIIQQVKIEDGVILDKIYVISELVTIIKNISNYLEFNLDNNVIYFDDGKFLLFTIELEDKKEELFNIDKLEAEKQFGVDSDIEDEISSIFSILKLKSDSKEAHNSYFYKNGGLFFNFKQIYIRKKSILSFIITDIFSLRIISSILLRNKGKIINYKIDIQLNKLILYSEDFYIESSIFIEDENSMNYLESYFTNIKKKYDVKFKLEFFNFLNAANSFDDESILRFEDNKILVNSTMKQLIGEFNIESINDNFFIITKILYKLFEYVFKKNKNMNEINFSVVESNSSKFIYFNFDGIDLITEIV
jgi:hypothetical protein